MTEETACLMTITSLDSVVDQIAKAKLAVLSQYIESHGNKFEVKKVSANGLIFEMCEIKSEDQGGCVWYYQQGLLYDWGGMVDTSIHPAPRVVYGCVGWKLRSLVESSVFVHSVLGLYL